MNNFQSLLHHQKTVTHLTIMKKISTKGFLLLTAIAFSLTCACAPARASAPACTSAQQTSATAKLAALEASAHGEIGVAVLNTENNQRIDYRAEEYFPLWSTSKVMVVAAILKRSMTDPLIMKERMTYTKEDLGYSPITKKHLTDGMTVSELCAAAIMFSDNTAMNLLMKKLGGYNVVTTFARSIDNNAFKFYLLNPKSNSMVYPTNLRVKSTPTAEKKSLQRLTLGNALAPAQQKQLLTWMKRNTLGNARIRAGVPKGWIVADKTGSGASFGATNDIGIIWPPKSAPIVVAIYFHTFDKNDTVLHNDVIAAATRMIVQSL